MSNVKFGRFTHNKQFSKIVSKKVITFNYSISVKKCPSNTKTLGIILLHAIILSPTVVSPRVTLSAD